MALKHLISERSAELPDIELGGMLSIAVRDHRVISLGPGEPDFKPPPHVIKAAQTALAKGFTHYSPGEGRVELLEAVSKKLKRENRIAASPENIMITNGSTEGILLGLMATIDPGEAVLVPDPSFVAYIPTVELLNGTAISLPVIPDNDWQLIPELVKKQVKEPKRTRAIIINTPANPTGAVYSKKTLEALADIAIENDLLIISDEAYEKFVYAGAKHISPASLNGLADRVLTLQTASKTYGMAGFRVGWAAGPPKLIATMRKLHLYTSLAAGTSNQLAAVAALNGPQSSVKKVVREFDRRRKYMYRRICQLSSDFTCREPKGAFYIFAKFALAKRWTSAKLAEHLLKTAHVVTVPGSDFGRYGEGYIRLSYATAMPHIEEGLDRLEATMKKLH
jgi:aminotransferase